MKRFAIVIALATTVSASAQSKKWTLQECVEYAMSNNISLKQSVLDQELARLDKADAMGAYLPNLNGSVSNAWNTGLTQNVTTGFWKIKRPETLLTVLQQAFLFFKDSEI